MRRFSAIFTMFLLFFMLGTAVSSAQTAGNTEVLDPGGHTLTWTGNWTKDTAASTATTDFEGVLLQGTDTVFGVVVYGSSLSGAEMRDVFVDSFGASLGGYSTIDVGSENGVHYELGSGATVTLYAVFIDGGLGAQSLGYFIVAPTATFANSVATAQADFKLNGGAVLNGVDGAGLQQRAQGGVATSGTTNTGTTGTTNTGTTGTTNTGTTGTTNTGTTGTTTQQPTTNVPANQTTGTTTQQTQRVVNQTTMVGATEIGWSGPWTHDVANSSPDQAMFSQADQATGSLKLVSYGEFVDASVTTPAAAIDTYTQAFFQGAGVTNATQLDGGTLANGGEWRLYRYTLQGVDLATFVSGSQNATGAFVVTTVTGNAFELMFTMIEVQEQFSINRTVSLLDGVDPILVTLSLLG